jgi:hypothetical protein
LLNCFRNDLSPICTAVLITGRKQHGDRNRGRADYYVEDALFIESPRAFVTGSSKRCAETFQNIDFYVLYATRLYLMRYRMFLEEIFIFANMLNLYRGKKHFIKISHPQPPPPYKINS